MEAVVWIAIVVCASQAALLSGLNLAVLGVSRLRLETEAATGGADAARVLALRQDPHHLLTTILWANVAANVLVALFADAVMAGIWAFVFSTVVLTLIGEIIPQAYFVRNAVRMGALLTPLLRFYRVLFYPVAKPTAMLLDRVLGPEQSEFFRERELTELLRRHAASREAEEVGAVEGVGAVNFLALDDIPLMAEGEPVDPRSVMELPFEKGRPVFPAFRPEPSDTFLRRIEVSRRKWVVLTEGGEPRAVMNADAFLRDALFRPEDVDPLEHCHRPLLSEDPTQPLGPLLTRLRVVPEAPGDDVVDEDLVLLWGEHRRIVTGSDLLGRLLRGIARVDVET